jgi:undecaprenyl-diphosphatase
LRFPFLWEVKLADKVHGWWDVSPTLNALMVTLAQWTPVVMTGLIALAATGFATPAGSLRWTMTHGLLSVCSAIVARVLNEPVSVQVARPRPFEVLGFASLTEHSRGNGFPSNHATGAFALAVGMAGVPHYFPILFALALLLASARVYTGLHFVTDVAAGALHGTAVSVFLLFTFHGILSGSSF